jgi:predicted RNA-binding protein
MEKTVTESSFEDLPKASGGNNRWLFSVNRTNWDVVLNKNLWGLRKEKAATSRRVEKGDKILFIVTGTRPLVFTGAFEVAEDWSRDSRPVWPDELVERKAIYPIRAKLRPLRIGSADFDLLVPKLGFVKKKSSPYSYLRGTPANFQKPIPFEDYEVIVAEIERNPGAPSLPVPPGKKPKSADGPNHDGLRGMIQEMGDMLGLVSQVEYGMDGWRLDVAWKRIATGIPSHAFEIQIGGNFYEALAKLKHAYDKWNSKPILVTTEKYAKEAQNLLSGSFHEVRDVAKVVNWQNVVELYKLMRKTWKLRDQIGVS